MKKLYMKKSSVIKIIKITLKSPNAKKFTVKKQLNCHIKEKKINTYIFSTNSCNTLFNTIEKLYSMNIKESKLFSFNKKFYLIFTTKKSNEFCLQINKYQTAKLEEYGKLLSNNAVEKIGYLLKNS